MSTSQRGSAEIIIIGLLVLALLGAVGYIAWTKFSATKPVVETIKTTEQKKIPDLIDYGKDGIRIVADKPDDVNKLHDAPDSFKKYLTDDLAKARVKDHTADPTGECQTADIVEKIYKQKFALGALSGTCIGGAAAIWAEVSGKWKVATISQDTYYKCSDLEKYKVPSALVGTTCGLEDGTPTTKDYNQD